MRDRKGVFVSQATYLVFGDLHGRILPAFRLALAWGREHSVAIDGLLQVGDLGYFPDASRLDSSTARFARKDPLELGARLVAEPSDEADTIFNEPDVPAALWCTLGNHEDYEIIRSWEQGAGRHATDFAVDAYLKVRCIRSGSVARLPGGLKVGALWGIDPSARRGTPSDGRIQLKQAALLSTAKLDVLLTHDSPHEAMLPDSGSEEISSIIRHAQPAFAFFGHYSGKGRQVTGDYGRTLVYHLSGMELRREGAFAEACSVGVLRWDGQAGSFEYLDGQWLRTISRHNWRHR